MASSRRAEEPWTIEIYHTSAIDGRYVVRPNESEPIQIHLEVGQGLFINFHRSLDMACSRDDGMIGPLPPGSMLDLGAGCFGWRPVEIAQRPVGLQFVRGAITVSLDVTVAARVRRSDALARA